MAIGTQWVTLDAQQFMPPYTPFAVYHAPARHWIESQSQVDAMVASGYLRGMSSANTMIADGERWISGAPTPPFLHRPTLCRRARDETGQRSSCCAALN